MKFLNIFPKTLWHYLGARLSTSISWLSMFLAERELQIDCVFKRKIGNTRQFTYPIPLPEKVNLGLFFHFEIN